MKVETTHPRTGKTKIVEMTPDEYRANKILNPSIRIVEDEHRGILDETGCRRYTMTVDSLNRLYKRLEDFVADCTQQEYNENKVAIAATMALIHKHINAESK